ncbi:PAS domain-containing sensor histidine kinase [Limnoglobus roseus]|uniref:PAS domain S-box protein n=1 Tax=Limnoglobus roseus TaxID=2598579 RepID=A0A5C1AR25_9BACT|nr:PAS domain-containing sensor histidine kinase [Limnoglobus roseus]QEL20426.1 PAS domain S-box protein [Limnoglobus roseus]
MHTPDAILQLIHSTVTDFAIVTMTPDRTVTTWSPGAEAILGHTAAEAVGRSADVIFTPEDRAAGVPEQEVSAAERDGRAADERWHVRNDGRRFYASGVLTRMPGGHLVKILRDLTARKRAEDALRDAHERLEERVAERTAELAAAVDALEAEMGRRREVSLRLAAAQEDERKRVSRDLHDTVGQTHAALAMALKAAADGLAHARGLADGMGRELHAAAVRLRPTALDDLGLEAAVRELAVDWSRQHGVAATVEVRVGGRLPGAVETTVYRVVQEALTNAAKHARAAAVGVTVFAAGGEVRAVVEDDGVGFDPTGATARLGLVGMRERLAQVGGEVEVESAPGRGTTIIARIPLLEGE